MAHLTQGINIHYRGSNLALLASDNQTPLYTVQIARKVPQLIMTRHESNKPFPSSPSSAFFSNFSTDVDMSIGGKAVKLSRAKFLSRVSHLTSCTGEVLYWKPDGTWTGDFQLVDKKGQVLARFRNKVLITAEVGSFEIIEERGEHLLDEVLISGLGMLVVVQSLGLGMMVLFGCSS